MNIIELKWACVIAFVAPIAYQRIKFHFFRHTFERLSLLRRSTGLDIHHGHWGLLILIMSGMWNSTFTPHFLATILFYFGLGLVTDEIAPLLKMPSKDRELELRVYAGSLRQTIVIAYAIVAIMVVLFQAHHLYGY